MNKKIYMVGFLILLSMGLIMAATKAPRPEGTLSRVIGLIEIKQGDAWVPAKVGEFLFVGNQLRSSKSGRGEITFRDGTLLHITRNSYMEILPARKEKRKSTRRIKFNAGEFWSKVIKGRNLDIESQVAIASIKGTEFSGEVSEDEFILSVYEGEVDLFNQMGKLSVKRNQKAKITKTSGPRARTLKKGERQKQRETFKLKIDHLLLGKLNSSQLKVGSVIALELKMVWKNNNKIDKRLAQKIRLSTQSGLGVSRTQSNFKQSTVTQMVSGTAKAFLKATKAGNYTVFCITDKVEPIAISVRVKKEAKKKTNNAPVATKRKASRDNTERQIKHLKGKVIIDGESSYPIEIILQEKK